MTGFKIHNLVIHKPITLLYYKLHKILFADKISNIDNISLL